MLVTSPGFFLCLWLKLTSLNRLRLVSYTPYGIRVQRIVFPTFGEELWLFNAAFHIALRLMSRSVPSFWYNCNIFLNLYQGKMEILALES